MTNDEAASCAHEISVAYAALAEGIERGDPTERDALVMAARTMKAAIVEFTSDFERYFRRPHAIRN